jgi:glutaredoxin-like protein NrdH
MIVIYSTPNCAPCHTLKYLLKKRDLPFEVKDITEQKNLNELRAYTDLTTVPITVVKGQVVTGTKASKIEEIYRGE